MLEQLMDLDSGFLMYIQEFMRNDAATRTFRGITTLGNAGAVWIAISLLLLVPKKTRRIGCMGLLALVLSLLFNNMLLKQIEAAGLRIAGRSGDDQLVEIIEVPNHPWFVACQFHPEFTSTPRDGHPLFAGFVKAASEHQKRQAK